MAKTFRKCIADRKAREQEVEARLLDAGVVAGLSRLQTVTPSPEGERVGERVNKAVDATRERR